MVRVLQTVQFCCEHLQFKRYNFSMTDEHRPKGHHVLVVLYLHGADAEASVDDELAEGRRPFVAVPTVDHEETA